MEIKIKNFGPLRSVDVEIKPMTVIIGKNNLGKSYTAELFYVLLNALKGYSRGFYSRNFSYNQRLTIRESYVLKEVEIRRVVQEAKRANLDENQVISSVANIALKLNCKILENSLKLELERAFGVDVSKLININSSYSTIECDLFKGGILHIELRKKEQVIVKLNVTQEKLQELTKKNSITLENIKQKRQKIRYFEELTDNISRDLFSLNDELELIEQQEVNYVLRKRMDLPFAYYVPAVVVV